MDLIIEYEYPRIYLLSIKEVRIFFDKLIFNGTYDNRTEIYDKNKLIAVIRPDNEYYKKLRVEWGELIAKDYMNRNIKEYKK